MVNLHSGNILAMLTDTTRKMLAGWFCYSLNRVIFLKLQMNGSLHSQPTHFNSILDTLLKRRQPSDPSCALYVVLAIQPIVVSLIVVASFVLSHSSAVSGSIFDIIAVLANYF